MHRYKIISKLRAPARVFKQGSRGISGRLNVEAGCPHRLPGSGGQHDTKRVCRCQTSLISYKRHLFSGRPCHPVL